MASRQTLFVDVDSPVALSRWEQRLAQRHSSAPQAAQKPSSNKNARPIPIAHQQTKASTKPNTQAFQQQPAPKLGYIGNSKDWTNAAASNNINNAAPKPPPASAGQATVEMMNYLNEPFPPVSSPPRASSIHSCTTAQVKTLYVTSPARNDPSASILYPQYSSANVFGESKSHVGGPIQGRALGSSRGQPCEHSRQQSITKSKYARPIDLLTETALTELEQPSIFADLTYSKQRRLRSEHLQNGMDRSAQNLAAEQGINPESIAQVSLSYRATSNAATTAPFKTELSSLERKRCYQTAHKTQIKCMGEKNAAEAVEAKIATPSNQTFLPPASITVAHARTGFTQPASTVNIWDTLTASTSPTSVFDLKPVADALMSAQSKFSGPASAHLVSLASLAHATQPAQGIRQLSSAQQAIQGASETNYQAATPFQTPPMPEKYEQPSRTKTQSSGLCQSASIQPPAFVQSAFDQAVTTGPASSGNPTTCNIPQKAASATISSRAAKFAEMRARAKTNAAVASELDNGGIIIRNKQPDKAVSIGGPEPAVRPGELVEDGRVFTSTAHDALANLRAELRPDMQHISWFNEYTRPERLQGALTAGPRKVLIQDLPAGTGIKDVTNIVWGGSLESISVNDAGTKAVVLFVDPVEAKNYSDATLNGIPWPSDPNHTVFVTLDPKIRPVSSLVTTALQHGFTRVVRANGKTDNMTSADIKKFVKRGKERRDHYEDIIRGSNRDLAYVDFIMCSIKDALLLAGEMRKHVEWEHCGIVYKQDPCSRATGPRKAQSPMVKNAVGIGWEEGKREESMESRMTGIQLGDGVTGSESKRVFPLALGW